MADGFDHNDNLDDQEEGDILRLKPTSAEQKQLEQEFQDRWDKSTEKKDLY